ncbi:protein of unknown function [Taphrina deformans PYCC 5710]|uniref:Protein kinase domain-containing protein n=1 Tax=Taphrina deformans (strain PYCC 5710 / ATCC 11124 / CBS 356.35 / IMI 108563 / JCM 9778 / NBRC 8474) TaxID=1097556 RepID=R4X9E3_TAPDE|nr:protein of unknown function [Taphrina deformans PYCC 5710]|eukprot:CCG82320.1 protein of unknown function [Taphrina deformans PYCC 5710]
MSHELEADTKSGREDDREVLRKQMSGLFERYAIPHDEQLLRKIFDEGFSYYDELADLDVGSLKTNLGLNLRTANIICKTAIRERQHIQPILQRIGELDPIDSRLVPPVRDGVTVDKIARLVGSLTELNKLGPEDDRRSIYLVQHSRIIYFWDDSQPQLTSGSSYDGGLSDNHDATSPTDAFAVLQRMTGETLTASHRRHLEGFEYASLRQMLRKNELEIKDCRELVARLNQTIKTYTAQSLWASTRMILLDRISHRNFGVSLHCVLYPQKFGSVVKVAKTGPEHIIQREWQTCQEIHEKVQIPSLVCFEAATQGRVSSESEAEVKFIIVMPYYASLSQMDRMKIEFETCFEVTVLKIMLSTLAAAWGCAMAGYYHGDIKPTNILLPTNDGPIAPAILIDLGSATPDGQQLTRRTPEWGLGVAGGQEYDKACLATSAMALMYPHWSPDVLVDVSTAGGIRYVERTIPEASPLRDFLISCLSNESYDTIWETLAGVKELEKLSAELKPRIK